MTEPQGCSWIRMGACDRAMRPCALLSTGQTIRYPALRCPVGLYFRTTSRDFKAPTMSQPTTPDGASPNTQLTCLQTSHPYTTLPIFGRATPLTQIEATNTTWHPYPFRVRYHRPDFPYVNGSVIVPLKSNVLAPILEVRHKLHFVTGFVNDLSLNQRDDRS